MNKFSCFLVLFLLLALFLADDALCLSKKCNLAEKLYLQGDYKGAVYECERLLREYKTASFRNDVAYLAGLSYLKLNDLSKARKYFEYVYVNSQNPSLISEAQIGLDYISKNITSVKEPDFFSVQVGSFRHKRNAERLYNKFKRRKYTVRVIKEEIKNISTYKVKIGKFKSRRDATRFAKKLRRSGYPTAIVEY